MSTQIVSGPKEPLLSRDCLFYYKLQGYNVNEFIGWAKTLEDHTIVEHVIECPQCHRHMRDRACISDDEMDTMLIAARNHIKKARESKHSIA